MKRLLKGLLKSWWNFTHAILFNVTFNSIYLSRKVFVIVAVMLVALVLVQEQLLFHLYSSVLISKQIPNNFYQGQQAHYVWANLLKSMFSL